MPRILPFLVSRSWPRSYVFRFVSELAIRYGPSAVAQEGTPRLRHGPRAGARLPDRRLTIDGEAVYLQRAVAGARFSLVLCGDTGAWDSTQVSGLGKEFDGLLDVHYLSSRPAPGALCDDGATLSLLGAGHGAQYLVRPDGYIAYRAGGYNLNGLARFLERKLHAPSPLRPPSLLAQRPDGIDARRASRRNQHRGDGCREQHHDRDGNGRRVAGNVVEMMRQRPHGEDRQGQADR